LERDIEVRITMGGAVSAFAEDWTCGIKLGDGRWPGLAAEPLFAADLLPVCAPALAARLKEPADLERATLLSVAHAAEDWPRWLVAAGVARGAVRGAGFAHYWPAPPAAGAGGGGGVGVWGPICDELAAARRRVPLRA